MGDVVLRMSIGREGIGLELARPASVGCARVITLASTFAGVRFPVNVSGGVTRFRHRRARLERFELDLNARALERWAAPRLRDAGWQRTPEVWAAFDSAEKVMLSVSTPSQTDDDPTHPAPAVAFDLHILSDRDDLMLIVANARGVDLPGPATAIAVACVEATIGATAKRSGTVFRFQGCIAMVARELLPQAGARVPSSEGVECSMTLVDSHTWLASARRNVQAAAPKDSALRAREAAALTVKADDELVSGDLDAARAAYLDALERAPRHPEIARRVVEIDAWTTGRAEAALEMIDEMGLAESTTFGVARGELLREAGDLDAAVADLERIAEMEPTPAIASLAYQRAARWATEAERASRCLDRAIDRTPRAASPRWARVGARLSLGHTREAMADVEHLDAMASGARAKCAVWMRAGRMWRALNVHGQARMLFERALRFVPDNPDALAGLAAALLTEGAATRCVALLVRALSMASSPDSTASIRLDLARALADHLDDLPAAIAHVTAIPDDARQAPVARGLEGRWRARLGDPAGAGIAYARLRELARSLGPEVERPLDDFESLPLASALDGSGRTGEIVNFLREAARWELSERHDPVAAEHHLAAAARLRPVDAATRQALPDVGPHPSPATSNEARPPGPSSAGTVEAALPDALASPAGNRAPFEGLDFMGNDGDLTANDGDAGALDVERSARVEDLSRRLQLDPTDDRVADELASLLEALGRGHELLALLSARLDDATPQRRVELIPRVRAILERLAAAAQAKGRADEASLYRSTAMALDQSSK